MSETLRAAFAARDWFPIVQHDPYLAFSELALREQAEAARSAWGLQRMEQIALVIVSPSSWPEQLIQELMMAVHRYLPTISMWGAVGDRLERIDPPPVAVQQARRDPKRPSPFPSAASQREGAAVGGAPPVATAVDASTPSLDVAQPSRISREEIDMLLRADGAGTWPAAASEIEP